MAHKWAVHIIAQDDVFEMPDELIALREANKINLSLAKGLAENHGREKHDPVVFAVVICM
jgi:hypothetical protein